jgi:hypothetical protein
MTPIVTIHLTLSVQSTKQFHKLRQRVSRLARSTLAFSKKVENHIGAIHYFICHYNLTRAALLV